MRDEQGTVGRTEQICAWILMSTLTCVALADASSTAERVKPSTEWPSYGLSYSEQRFSELGQVNVETVSKLGLAYSLDLPSDMRSLQATPLMINDTLYFTGSHGHTFAVDAESGNMLWHWDPELSKHSPERLRLNMDSNRGVAYWEGKVFVGTTDGRLVALDAKTGKQVWSVATASVHSNKAISGAPRAYNGKVVIGNGGAEFLTRGYVTAYSAEDGKQLWRFYTVPGNPADGFENEAMKLAAKTWGGRWWELGGGGTVWNSITYDAEFNQLYLGVGNAGPYSPRLRSPGGGDNLFICSIVALDADSGEYKWHYQYNPAEAWDWKATADIVLADLTIDNKRRKVLMQAPSNGFFYVLDRADGRLISAEKYAKVNWASHIDLTTGRPVEYEGIRYENEDVTLYPSTYGAHNWQAMSYSPDTGLVYLPYLQLGATWFAHDDENSLADPRRKRIKHLINIGAEYAFHIDEDDPRDGKGALIAWDPVSQTERWRVEHDAFWNGGTLTTAGNLVFQGEALGEFAAYNAATGEQLWSYDAKLGVNAPPMTYEINGTQYISLLVGWGGAASFGTEIFRHGWKFGEQPRRLLTFTLGGSAKLPYTPPPNLSTQAKDVVELEISEELADHGEFIYNNGCTHCHGVSLDSTGAVGPDLKESIIATNEEALKSVLVGGALASRGMPRFSELTDEDVKGLYHFIREISREYLTKAVQTNGVTDITH